MSLQAGHKLAHYEILEPIGKGGMGEVYRANDSKLGRDVAIKVLPDEFAQDEERLRRFQREAKVLASLNHPNIASIYGLEQSGETHYLVLELVPGETLAERISRGPIPVEEALEIATKIAEALEEAHEHGIIHRDLKPANIKQTEDGKIKVLDFGLAKVFQEDGEANDAVTSMSPTITRDATRVGVILGTAAYMSPEQARGKPVDKQTDIWAFGCCFYEALTGRAAFLGETVSDTIGKILEREPDWQAVPAGVPAVVQSLLRRCLRKDPARRLHDIADARIEFEEARGESDLSMESRSPDRRSVPLGWVAASTILSAAVAGLTVWGISGPSGSRAARTTRLEMQLHPNTSIPDFDNASLAVSADGARIVYSAVGGDGKKQLYVREMNQFESTPVRGTEGNPRGPFFSPDGERVGFYDSGTNELKQVSLRGGRPSVICKAAPAYRGGTWGDDERIVISSYTDGLLRGSATVSGCESLAKPDGKFEKTYYYPQILPDGEWVLHTVGTFEMDSYDDAQIAVVSLRTGVSKTLFDGGTHARYVSSGHIVYSSGGSLLAAPFDLAELEMRGAGVAVVDGVMTFPASGTAQFSTSDDGLLAYVAGAARGQRQLVWVDREGVAQPLPLDPRGFDFASVSADGRLLAVEIDEGTAHVWVYDLERDNLVRLTFEGNDEDPIWTPDGRVAFDRFIDGRYKLVAMDANGSGEEEELIDLGTTPGAAASFLPDGSLLAYNSGSDIWLLPLRDERTPSLFLGTRFRERRPSFSPDGRWVAYQSDESGQDEVYLTAYAADGNKRMISTNGGMWPKWNPNGRELFYHDGDGLLAVDVVTEPSLRLSQPRRLFVGNYLARYDVAPDGHRFLMIQSVDEPRPTHINLVQNWFEELDQVVPTN